MNPRLLTDAARLTLESLRRRRTDQPTRAQTLRPDERNAVLDYVFLLQGLLRAVLQMALTGRDTPGMWEAIRAAVPPLDEPLPPPKAPRSFTQRMEDIGAELVAIEAVAIHANRIRLTAVVDDDFPQVKHEYDAAIDRLVDALRTNERIP